MNESATLIRAQIATTALHALITAKMPFGKKQMCDQAIAYADMLLRRLAEIPADAQQRSEAGQIKK